MVYPGSCRGRWRDAAHATSQTGRPAAYRVQVSPEPVGFVDEFAGPQQIDLAGECGDFVIFKNDGGAGYQLAVVLDDASDGVTDVVRGDDLLDSAARQLLLHDLLGIAAAPHYWHLPLVVGPEGRRLAKRHGDTRLSHYRQLGVPPERILGLVGYWSGLLPERKPATLAELGDAFDISSAPTAPVVMTPADEAFLLDR